MARRHFLMVSVVLIPMMLLVYESYFWAASNERRRQEARAGKDDTPLTTRVTISGALLPPLPPLPQSTSVDRPRPAALPPALLPPLPPLPQGISADRPLLPALPPDNGAVKSAGQISPVMKRTDRPQPGSSARGSERLPVVSSVEALLCPDADVAAEPQFMRPGEDAAAIAKAVEAATQRQNAAKGPRKCRMESVRQLMSREKQKSPGDVPLLVDPRDRNATLNLLDFPCAVTEMHKCASEFKPEFHTH